MTDFIFLLVHNIYLFLSSINHFFLEYASYRSRELDNDMQLSVVTYWRIPATIFSLCNNDCKDFVELTFFVPVPFFSYLDFVPIPYGSFRDFFLIQHIIASFPSKAIT